MDSAPSGSRNNFPRGENAAPGYPKNALVMIPDKTKKGKREGMTVCRQRLIPSCAPDSAGLLSRIKIQMHTIAPRPEGADLYFMVLTSKESMQVFVQSFISFFEWVVQ